MKTKPIGKLAILACTLVWAFSFTLPAQTPNLVGHQGRVAVNGVNFDGTGQFKFALVNSNGSTSYWSNDGTSTAGSQPAAAVSLPVTKGLYSVLLGDASLTNMAVVPVSVFQNADVRLRVWFNDGVLGFQLLTPDQRLAPSGYLPAGAVAAGSLADGSVTGAKIAAGTVIPSQTVAGTSQATVANTSYSAASDSPTTFTLPTTANIGDMVEITGAGSGGWSVLPGGGQGLSAPWEPRENNRAWLGLSSSADGNKLAAVVDSGQIHTSTDAGVTWTPRETSRAWRAVASSADGTKLVAVVTNGQIHTSTDSGVTWTPRETSRAWRAVASSADGTNLVAVVFGGYIYVSNDSGISWDFRDSIRQWQSVASSSDGSKLVAAVLSGQIYTSTNSGLSWTPRESVRNWLSVTSSADGVKLAAASGDAIHISTNSGLNWSQVKTGAFGSVASSADGTKLVAPEFLGRIQVSTDGGNSWMPQDSTRDWTLAASSADGSKLIAADQYRRLYTSDSTTAAGQGGHVTLQYLGNGQWTATRNKMNAADLTGSIPPNVLASVPAANLTGSVPSISLTSVPAASLTGSIPSSVLASVPAANLFGSVPSAVLTSVPAANLTGTISDVRLSANVALRGGGNAFSGNQSITGNVGIGTTSPGKPLQVGDANISNSEGMIRFASRSGTGPSSRYWDIGVPEGDQDTSGKFYSFVIDDPTSGGDPEMTIRWDSGNVGLGTANPQGRLHVYSTSNPTVMRVQSSGSPGFGRLEFVSNPQGDANEWRPAYIQSTDSGGFTGGLSFVVNGTGAASKFTEVETMRIQNGRVGIGTAAPVSALQVIGTVTATAFNPPSDRHMKENFRAVDPQEVLAKVTALPISEWNFIGDAATPHIGPMAQDFHAAFGLGTDERHIATVDADGVALAAIQGLNEKLEDKESVIADLRNETSALREKNAAMEARLAALEELLSRQPGVRTKSNPAAR